ncbi:TadE family protein [Microbacterium oleivorans]|uniref:TadE family protein n=2 Tax=Microbacterium oleivorans TaxID=273677 RepID=A0A7D5EYQ4_9MICO|nr:TadE family protein [Microbacterium oleivorans]
MRRDESPAADAGSASLEFVVAGMVLLVPVVYLVVALGVVQAHALGVQATARHVARAVAVSPGPATAGERAEVITEAVAAEYSMDPVDVALEIVCPGTGACPRAGDVIIVTADVEVALPFVPPVLGLDRVARVPVAATAVQRMSRVWGTS